MHLIHVEDDRLESELVRSALSEHVASARLVQVARISDAVRETLEIEGPVAVLCDHQLPDGTAKDLLYALEDRPDVRVVIMSGFITPRVAALRDHPNVVEVFEKPMHLSELEHIVEVVVGSLPTQRPN